MRGFAHELVDLLFDHIEQVEERPVVDWTAADELRRLVRIDQPPADGIDLARLVAEKSIQLHHPMYMGHQGCPPPPPPRSSLRPRSPPPPHPTLAVGGARV